MLKLTNNPDFPYYLSFMCTAFQLM